jgi:hypothetical protein
MKKKKDQWEEEAKDHFIPDLKAKGLQSQFEYQACRAYLTSSLTLVGQQGASIHPFAFTTDVEKDGGRGGTRTR